VQLVPESELDISDGAGELRGYNGTFGLFFSRSSGSDYGDAGRSYPAAKWHAPMVFDTDSTTHTGTQILSNGGSTAELAPNIFVKLKGYQGTGIDTSGATFAGSVIKVGPAQTFTDGTVTKTLAELAEVGEAGDGMTDPGANGIVKRTALNTTEPAISSDVVALFDGGACGSDYLKGDGTCGAVSGTPAGADRSIQFNDGGTFGGFGGYASNGQITIDGSNSGAGTPTLMLLGGGYNTARYGIRAIFGDTPGFMGQVALGSHATPTVVGPDTYTNFMSGGAHDGNVWPTGSHALLGFKTSGQQAHANSACTGSSTPSACCTGVGTGTCVENHGSYITFETTATTARSEKMRVHGSGDVSINTGDVAESVQSAVTDTNLTVTAAYSKITCTSTTSRTVTLPASLPAGMVTKTVEVCGSGAVATIGTWTTVGAAGSVSWGDTGAPTFTSGKCQYVTFISANAAATSTAAWRGMLDARTF
jgi:hypothetical protein